jgi:hypothetical protein
MLRNFSFMLHATWLNVAWFFFMLQATCLDVATWFFSFK